METLYLATFLIFYTLYKNNKLPKNSFIENVSDNIVTCEIYAESLNYLNDGNSTAKFYGWILKYLLSNPITNVLQSINSLQTDNDVLIKIFNDNLEKEQDLVNNKIKTVSIRRVILDMFCKKISNEKDCLDYLNNFHFPLRQDRLEFIMRLLQHNAEGFEYYINQCSLRKDTRGNFYKYLNFVINHYFPSALVLSLDDLQNIDESLNFMDDGHENLQKVFLDYLYIFSMRVLNTSNESSNTTFDITFDENRIPVNEKAQRLYYVSQDVNSIIFDGEYSRVVNNKSGKEIKVSMKNKGYIVKDRHYNQEIEYCLKKDSNDSISLLVFDQEIQIQNVDSSLFNYLKNQLLECAIKENKMVTLSNN